MSNAKGKSAEKIAADYLSNMGYEIVKMNFHFGKQGEIDIVARQGSELVFVEVKSRYNDKYGTAIESITPGKIKKFRRTVDGYLYVNKIEDTECRIDLIAIDFHGSDYELDHIEDAF